MLKSERARYATACDRLDHEAMSATASNCQGYLFFSVSSLADLTFDSRRIQESNKMAIYIGKPHVQNKERTHAQISRFQVKWHVLSHMRLSHFLAWNIEKLGVVWGQGCYFAGCHHHWTAVYAGLHDKLWCLYSPLHIYYWDNLLIVFYVVKCII